MPGSDMLRRFIDHPLFIWTLLALPSLLFVLAVLGFEPARPGETVERALLGPTGEFSVRFLILSMLLTPMRRIFPQSGFWRWMMKRRRYIGLAAFAYAVLHLNLYLVGVENAAEILAGLGKIELLLGWGAFMVMLPLALTSNDRAVRRLGLKWKALQRWVYPVAIAVALHWVLVSDSIGPVIVHFAPLALLEGYRILGNYRRRARRAIT